MQTLSGLWLFTVGDKAYVWEDLVCAARLWGDWASLESEVRRGLACLKRLDELDDEGEALADEEANAAAEFRYARDLVAAQDMEAWLERRGLTADEWLGYIRRSLLVTKWAHDLEQIREAYPVSQDEVDEAIVCDALCGGQAAALASKLAGRAAAYAALLEEAPDGRDGIPEGEVRSMVDAFPVGGSDGAPSGLPRDGRQERLDALARLEVAWRRFAARQATPQAIGQHIAGHHLDWIRLRVRAVTFADPNPAREAVLCVREDGRDLAEVAAEAGAKLDEAEWYLEEVDEGLRAHVLGARPGDLLGPLRVNDGYVIVSVLAKQLPSELDPELRARAERALLARAVEREVCARVTWHLPL